jgi:hypothetical protein
MVLLGRMPRPGESRVATYSLPQGNKQQHEQQQQQQQQQHIERAH